MSKYTYTNLGDAEGVFKAFNEGTPIPQGLEIAVFRYYESGVKPAKALKLSRPGLYLAVLEGGPETPEGWNPLNSTLLDEDVTWKGSGTQVHAHIPNTHAHAHAHTQRECVNTRTQNTLPVHTGAHTHTHTATRRRLIDQRGSSRKQLSSDR